jgi:REP-associated tyrosine transposase
MRNTRMKVSGEGCYYHLINRISGCKGEFPFTDVDKEYGFRLLKNLSRYFLVEIISAAWMGNHFHLVVYAPGPDELPSTQEIAARHNTYYKSMRKIFKYGKLLPKINPRNITLCRETGLKMIDISYFMRAYQQRFTTVYNQTRERRGQLWGNRFKSVILEKNHSLEACVAYVELNPVRAGLVDDPADYRFTTWGRYCGSGRHMFHDNFVKHLKKDIMSEDTSKWDDAEVFAYLHSELTRIVVAETGADSEEIFAAKTQARRSKESMPIRFLRRTRHFSDGAIIGSKLFIREVAGKFQEQERVNKKQFSRGISPSGAALYCFRKLQC